MTDPTSKREILTIVFVLIAGAALYVENALTGRALWISLALTAFVTSVTFLVVSLYLKTLSAPLRHDLRDAISRLDTLVQFVLKGHKDIAAILTDSELATRESRVHGEVWVISRDLAYDTETFMRIVRENLRRGVSYRYLIPDNPEIIRKFLSLRDDLTRDLAIKPVSPQTETASVTITARVVEGLFPFLAEHGIYDPKDAEHRTGFTVFPEQRAEYNIILSTERTTQLCDIFRDWWEKGKRIGGDGT